MKKIELKEGQVWQVPDKKWIRVRAIVVYRQPPLYPEFHYGSNFRFFRLGDRDPQSTSPKSFRQWIRRNNAKIIGIKNFKTGKVVVVK